MAPDEHTEQSTLRIDEARLEQLMLWHGTDESRLPPAHTLQNLSRDTIAALTELREARQTIEQLRAAMGRAFWATEFPELHAILLEALGPPPGDDTGARRGGLKSAKGMIQRTLFNTPQPNRDVLDNGLKRKHPLL